MLKKTLVSFIFINAIGCGKVPITPEIDIRLMSFYNQFLNDASIRGIYLNTNRIALRIAPLTMPTIGHCSYGVVTINESYYKNKINDGNVNDVKQLIYNELGHCLLGLPHDDSKIDIMNTVHIEDNVYSQNENELINNFFAKVLK